VVEPEIAAPVERGDCVRERRRRRSDRVLAEQRIAEDRLELDHACDAYQPADAGSIPRRAQREQAVRR
jgi:hypothetical protein